MVARTATIPIARHLRVRFEDRQLLSGLLPTEASVASISGVVIQAILRHSSVSVARAALVPIDAVEPAESGHRGGVGIGRVQPRCNRDERRRIEDSRKALTTVELFRTVRWPRG